MRRNVLQLVGSFAQGGSERQAVQLTRLLVESGRYGVRLACLDAGGPLREEAERLGVGEIPEFRLNNFYDRRMAAQLRRFARYVREQEIDVVQTHDFYTNIFGMLGAALARVPVRIAARRDTGGMQAGLRKWVERRAYGLAHAVVANAEAVRARLVAQGTPERKTLVIYNGLDWARLRVDESLSREERLGLLGLPRELAGRPVVTLVANPHHEVKGHAMFLRAARRVHESAPRAAFVVAGEGGLKEQLRAQAAAAGLAADVFFIGRCARVGDLLAASSVGVLSSKAEGFSNSILEYMAAGLPVVATDVGGAREAIVEGETGRVVPPEDDGAMAAAVLELLGDPARAAEMGARGRRRVAEKFSCEEQLRLTEGLYEALLARRPARTRLESAGALKS